MDVISQFIENYRKKYTFYETAARLAQELLQDALRSSGIRAIVTSRAKSPARLRVKVTQRNEVREVPYKNMGEIYKDIADLAGVRVSLYFPGDRDKAEQAINNLFLVTETRKFPSSRNVPAARSDSLSGNRRFSGYWATHYRASLREELLDKKQQKYVPVRMEIQVASVLMHAWSEVEHDLVYKPIQGTLSDEELAILDELNGLVLAGEIALERLQAAGNARLQSKNASFDSQYDLAAYLYSHLHSRYKNMDIDPRMGNVELLLKLLVRLRLDNARQLEPLLRSLRIVNDRRTISQQITDRIICGSEKRYRLYLELAPVWDQTEEHTEQAIKYFLLPWISLETILGRLTQKNNPQFPGSFNLNALKRLKLLDPAKLNRLNALRTTRNELVHNIRIPDNAELIRMGDEVRKFLSALSSAQPQAQS